MRVKISYGIDVKNVPSRAQEIGTTAIGTLNAAVDSLQRAVKSIDDFEEDYSSVLYQLNSVREKLNDVDLAMSDIEAILGGLTKYYNGEEDVSDRRPTMDSGRNVADSKKEPPG